MYTRKLVIIRHTCHIYIYLLVIFIFSLVTKMISSFIKMYLISPFLILFWWLRTFFNDVIFRSTSKTFPRHTFRTSVVRITSRTIFFFLFSDPFEKKSLLNGWHLHKKCTFSEQYFLSHYFYHKLSFCQYLYSQSVRIN